ncbi:hypothetical protein ACTHGU_02490 [Chitinophagaceae bacterium MMS25-I14]
MASVLFAHYHKEDLKGLIKCLNEDYYDPIIQSCIQISGFADYISSKTPDNVAGNLYISRCIRMLDQIKQEVETSKYVIAPYVNELYEKDTDGHNCSTCSGKCSIQHKVQIEQIKAIHKKINDIIQNIKQLEQPLSERGVATEHDGKIIHNELAILDNVITEMFYIEEEILMPKILEAQKHINAK